MDAIDGNLPIAVTLPAAQWNQVIAFCADGVWRLADPLIKEITRQIFEAAAHAQRPFASNGAAEPAGGPHVSD